ncbi:MAG: hypothetical protein H6730_36745 [Deltaproteobacteria bacterium]|nr:hypothetical protein [Deltaproteobacteria bacterium]
MTLPKSVLGVCRVVVATVDRRMEPLRTVVFSMAFSPVNGWLRRARRPPFYLLIDSLLFIGQGSATVADFFGV